MKSGFRRRWSLQPKVLGMQLWSLHLLSPVRMLQLSMLLVIGSFQVRLGLGAYVYLCMYVYSDPYPHKQRKQLQFHNNTVYLSTVNLEIAPEDELHPEVTWSHILFP